MKYTHRNSLLTSIQTIKINSDGINVLNENEELIDQLSFSEIKSIALVNTSNPTAQKLQQCTILTKNNKKHIIRSYSYLNLGNFRDQSNEYFLFLIKLHDCTRPYEYIEYKKGINKIGYFTFLFFMICMIILMCAVITGLYFKNKYPEMTICVFILLFFVYLIQVIVRNIKPDKYSPDIITK